MKIGMDVDGVHSQFVPAFNSKLIGVTGKNLLPDGVNTEAPMWDWPQHFGYTNEETKQTFKAVADSPIFWYTLKPFDDAEMALSRFNLMSRFGHDVYFITNRAGKTAKKQTEEWLIKHGFYLPTVLISAEKDILAKGLGLDVYIDDHHGNANLVAKNAFPTISFLLNRPWNQNELVLGNVRRIDNLQQFVTFVEGMANNGVERK